MSDSLVNALFVPSANQFQAPTMELLAVDKRERFSIDPSAADWSVFPDNFLFLEVELSMGVGDMIKVREKTPTNLALRKQINKNLRSL